MKLKYGIQIILSLLLLNSSFDLHSQPITTPIKWEGLDTLSKFYQFEQFKKQHQSPDITKEKSGIPFRKDGQDGLLDLITDPRVLYSSYFGGNGYDCSYGIAVDSKDNMILVGYSGSTNLPTTTGCFQKDKNSGHDAFIAKFTPDGQPIWITYYGGSATDVAKGCVIDKEDNIYVVGKTNSTDFPVTKGKFNGFDTPDAFILKFSPTGERIWSVLYGSSQYDTGEGIALMSDGGFVIAGYTNGTDLPVTDNALYKSLQGNADAFIARFNSDGDLVWGTYYGGYQNEITTCIATDKNDNIAVGGYHETVSDLAGNNIFPTTSDAFQRDTSEFKDGILLLLSGDCKLKYSTFYGGHAKTVGVGDGEDLIDGVTFDDDGKIYCCGYTSSYDFPVTQSAFKSKYDSHDAFILKFSKDYQREWATFYGGDSGDELESISFDKNGYLWLTGWTMSRLFPVIGDSIQGIPNPAIVGAQIILLKMNLNGKPVYSAYYGHGLCFGYSIFSKYEMFYFTGEINTFKFPYTENAFNKRIVPNGYTSYLAKIDLTHTDVDDGNQKSVFNLFPNPVKDKTKIEISDLPCQIKIYSLLGILMKEFLINDNNNLELDLSFLDNGIYLLQLQLKNKIYSNKLIKLN